MVKGSADNVSMIPSDKFPIRELSFYMQIHANASLGGYAGRRYLWDAYRLTVYKYLQEEAEDLQAEQSG